MDSGLPSRVHPQYSDTPSKTIWLPLGLLSSHHHHLEHPSGVVTTQSSTPEIPFLFWARRNTLRSFSNLHNTTTPSMPSCQDPLQTWLQVARKDTILATYLTRTSTPHLPISYTKHFSKIPIPSNPYSPFKRRVSTTDSQSPGHLWFETHTTWPRSFRAGWFKQQHDLRLRFSNGTRICKDRMSGSPGKS